jgi:hypothetical protein
MLVSMADIFISSEKADMVRGDGFRGSKCVWVVQKVMHHISSYPEIYSKTCKFIHSVTVCFSYMVCSSSCSPTKLMALHCKETSHELPHHSQTLLCGRHLSGF